MRECRVIRIQFGKSVANIIATRKASASRIASNPNMRTRFPNIASINFSGARFVSTTCHNAPDACVAKFDFQSRHVLDEENGPVGVDHACRQPRDVGVFRCRRDQWEQTHHIAPRIFDVICMYHSGIISSRSLEIKIASVGADASKRVHCSRAIVSSTAVGEGKVGEKLRNK